MLFRSVFVRHLQKAFEKAAILPWQTRLLIRDAEEEQIAALIASEGKYGYGSATSFDEYELAARLMMQKLPPCDTIRFDDQARARDDFQALIIGFGRMSRAAPGRPFDERPILRQCIPGGYFR